MAVIAVVEDNLSNMKLICGVLAHAGYTVIKAGNAEEGLPLIRQMLPDLVLMDIHMPGIDGMAATRLLKADKLTSHIPVIALTARAMDGDRETILRAGCDGYAAKPIRYKEVLELIRQQLER
ncbi:MAG: response regulator [Gammaproteobacteria bacterium]|nr:response regulator [Gammaproteobacteria bacterium]